MRTLGPIGMISADIRRIIEIKEDEAILGVVKRKRKLQNDEKEKRQTAGGRFVLLPNFAVPGPFADRPLSGAGHVTFHFARDVVTKGPGGCSILHASTGTKKLSSSAPADHDSYVARSEAVMALTAADFDAYAGRESAVELLGDGRVALLTNISPDPAVRRDYWRKVHEHEREAQPDALEFHPSRLPTASWLEIAAIEQLPTHVREMAATMGAAKGRKGNAKKPAAEVEMNRREAAKLLAVIRDELADWDWKKPPIRLRKGRGGRTQFRVTAEFPIGIDAAARLRITSDFCRDLDAVGVMYTAAIHAPDHHNDERNFHLHIAYHDRPAKLMEDGRWDFEVKEMVPGQWNRYRYPFRQPKIAELSRDPEGGNYRAYASSKMRSMREQFADLCNREMQAAGIRRLFDARSYAAMGIEQSPTRPLGPKSAALEAVGIPTGTGIANAEIIWTAALQQNIKQCEDARKTRDVFRARVDNAVKALAAADDRDLSQRIEALAVRYDEHARFLATHEMEIGELGITLAMAHARPTKTADTCLRLLEAIENGKAKATDVKDRALIEERRRAAENFLGGIDAIYEQRRAILEPLLDRRDTAVKELVGITSTLKSLLCEDVEAVLGQKPLVEARQPVSEVHSPVRPDRELVDEILDRITKNDLPVLLPDDSNDNYRVKGISRDEYRLLDAEHFSRWVQKRLEGISKIQRDRMKEAADLLRQHGQDGLDRLAVTDSNARRALKHLAAYKDHATLISLTRVPEASLARHDSSASNVSAGEKVPADADRSTAASSYQSQAADGAGRTTSDNLSPVPTIPETKVDIAYPYPTPDLRAVEKAIEEYAQAIRSEPGVRLIERSGQYEVDPKSVPNWLRSAEAFSDRPAVRDAIRDRRDIEQEKDHSQTRVRIIHELGRCGLRPLERIGDRWHINNLSEDLLELAHRWQDHEELAAAYRHLNAVWTARELLAAQEPPKQALMTNPGRQSVVMNVEQELDVDNELPHGWSNSRNGQGRS